MTPVVAMAKNKSACTNVDSLQEIHEKLNKILESLANQDKRIAIIEACSQEQTRQSKEINDLKVNNIRLSQKVKELQNDARKAKLEKNKKKIALFGVPRQENECLKQIMMKIAEKGDVGITDTDIKDIYRRKDTPRGPGQIMVKLGTVRTRNSILQGTQGKKLHTTDLGFTGLVKPIYVNAPLTNEAQQILYHAREAKDRMNWARVWVYGAEVYMSLEKQGTAIKIESMENLETLIQ